MLCFMLSVQSDAKKTVKKLGGGGGSIFYLNLTSRCPPSPRDGQRDDTAQGGWQDGAAE